MKITYDVKTKKSTEGDPPALQVGGVFGQISFDRLIRHLIISGELSQGDSIDYLKFDFERNFITYRLSDDKTK